MILLRRRILAALVAALAWMPAISGSGPAAATTHAAPRGATAITAAQLRDYLTFIASDDMEGRDTPSRGLDITARFLATELARSGVEPGGDNGSYLQRIPLTNRRVNPARTNATMGERTFVFGEDFLAGGGGERSGANLRSGTAEGALVYVGHGYVVKAKNIDAYKGIDVTGKILISQSGLPKGVERNDVRGKSGEAWESATTYAARHGAKGVIFIPNFDALANWEERSRRSVDRGSTTMDRITPEPANAATPAAAGDNGSEREQPGVPAITASLGMLQALFEGETMMAQEIFRLAQANDPAYAFALKATKTVRFTVDVNTRPIATQNVVGIVRGSDPTLKEEYVALGAHYDHVGVAFERPGSTRDVIYNGADDDGSGTTALLAIAEACAKLTPRPKRSLLFVWHAGEEHGLWGSKYFTQRPTVPIDRIVTQLNIDMIGRSRRPDDKNTENMNLTGPDEVYVIGSKMMSSALGELSERANASYLNLSFNYKLDDPNDPNRFFFRSDHYNYAKRGVPIIFYFSGVHEDYHQPSDSVDKIDFTKMEKITRTVYATALAVAESPTRPKVDRSLPKELTEQ